MLNQSDLNRHSEKWLDFSDIFGSLQSMMKDCVREVKENELRISSRFGI